MDEKQAQEMNALEQAAFNDPVNFLNTQQDPRKWTLSSDDIARSYSITPAELLHTEDELHPKKWNVAETLGREFVDGAANIFTAVGEGVANDKLNQVIYRSSNMSKEDGDRLVEDVLRSQVLSRNRKQLESARKVHDVWSSGIGSGVGSVMSMALVGWATKSPAAVGALTGVGEAYNVRNELIDRYVDETGSTQGIMGEMDKYNALAATYGLFSGAVEASIGVERLAAGSLNRYGKLAALQRLARQKGEYGKALAYKTGREVVASGAEEFGEEFLQSIGEDVAISLAQDIWTDPDIKKALTQGMFGAIIGAPSGAIFYNGSRKKIIDYINKWNKDKNAGLTDGQVVQMTDEILGDGTHHMLDEVTTRVELQQKFGKAFETVKDRIGELVDATGVTPWVDENKTKEQYIQDVAYTITAPMINKANIWGMPLSEFLDVAQMNITPTATGFAPILNFEPIASVDDLKRLLDVQNAIIKEETDASKIGNANPGRKENAQRRKAILQYNIRAQELSNKRRKQRIEQVGIGGDIQNAQDDVKHLKDSPTQADFIGKLSKKAQDSLKDDSGKVSKKKSKDRYQNALLKWVAGNDDELFEKIMLDKTVSQKVIDVLATHGSALYELDSKYPDLGIRKDLYHALKKMQVATKDNFLEITQWVENRNVMPENVMIWNWLYADVTTNREFMGNYISTLRNNVENVNAGEDIFGDKNAPLSKKDALIQALKKTDETRAQLSAERGREYESLFTEIGEIRNPELSAAVISYNNQFGVQPTQMSSETLQQFDLADENARLDDIYPEYAGETIEVDGKERTVYNSNGDRIAKSKEALTNFWKWFGDSKVVDEQGRPLVVYHGSLAQFDAFDPNRFNTSGGNLYGAGFYFSNNFESAEDYGANVVSVYLKLNNPFVVEKGDTISKSLSKKGVSKQEIIDKYGYAVEYGEEYPNSPSDIGYQKQIMSMGYDGVMVQHEFDNEYVAFNSTQIKSVDNRGTYSDKTGNIYFQSVKANITDVSTKTDIKEMREDAREYFDKIVKKQDINHPVLGHIIVSNKGIDEFIHYSANKDKLALVPHLKELIETSTVSEKKQLTHKRKDGFVAFYELYNDANIDGNVYDTLTYIGVDRNGNLFYDVKLNKNSQTGGLDTKSSGSSATFNITITPQSSNVKQLSQRRAINGFYDPELQAIVLGKHWNETTLVHEFHHRYLEKIWGIYQQAQQGVRTVSPEFMDDVSKLFEMLDIDPSQQQLTTVQQEKFASMVEAYITGLGVDNPENLAFQTFMHWIPEKYKSIMDIGYLDENGLVKNPILDEASIDFFNKWFASPFAPSLPSAPDAQRMVNVTDDKGEIIPSNQKVMNNREKEWGQDSEEQLKADAQLYRAIGENNPSNLRAALDGEEELMKAESKNLDDDRILPEKSKLRDKWFKTRQKDARTLAADKAREYLEKNPEHARELAFADPETMTEFDAPVDHGMLIRAVMETVGKGSDEWYILDNNLAIVKSMSGSTLSLSGDLSHQAYLDAKREVENARELKAAVNYAGTRQGAMDKWNSDIRAFAARRVAAIMATEPNSEERKTAIKAFLEEAKTKFSGNTTNAILNQLDLTGVKTKSSQVFIKWAEKQIKEAAHAKIDTKEQAELMKASVKAQLALRDIDSTELKDGQYARAIQSSKDIRHWQFVKDKMKKAYIGRWGKFGIFWDNLLGGYMPSAMLMSVNTLFFANVPSNVINTGIVRRAARHIGENKVDSKVTEGEIKRIKQIFNASGMNLAQMEKPSSPSTLHGEKYMNTEQAHWYNFTFEILGKTDNLFRIPTFVDALARIATKDADGDKAKATVLFKEYIKLNNTTEEAKIARKQALAVANMAVFTQDGTMATGLNHIRSQLNNISRSLFGLEPGGFGFGSILAPFLKTGANIAEMGIKATFAPVRQLVQLGKKAAGKEIPELDKLAMRVDWTYFAWTCVATALMAAITSDDDEWYIEPYESGRPYDPNRPYDSIKIGGVWLKLDVLGVFAIPLRTSAMLVKDWETRKLGALGDGMLEALSDTPLVNQFTDSNLGFATRKPGKWASTFIYNQANKLVPAQLKTVTKATSRATDTELDVSILGPTIERKFHRNYGLDGERLTTNDLILLFTNRLKTNPE